MDDSVESEQDTAGLFTDAYRQHASAVLAYLRSQGLEDPEAVTQDTFAALYPRLGSVTGGPAGLRTLIFSIAHARVVDHHRHRQRVPSHLEYDPSSDGRSTPSAEDQVVQGRLGIEHLMARLAPEHRDVIALRILGDLSIEEVARIMDKSAGAIKQLQRRALLALRRELSPEPEKAR